LASASSMLLFHASAVLGAVALAERGIVHGRIGTAAGFGFVLAAGLFAGDLTLRHYAGHGLFPFAAPTGGALLIVSWLGLAVAAGWPVQGGGPQIATMLKRLGIQSEFAAGLRITDAATIEIVEMVLAGSVNKQLVGYINEAGGKAVGLSGKDGNMVKASKTTRTMVDPD